MEIEPSNENIAKGENVPSEVNLQPQPIQVEEEKVIIEEKTSIQVEQEKESIEVQVEKHTQESEIKITPQFEEKEAEIKLISLKEEEEKKASDGAMKIEEEASSNITAVTEGERKKAGQVLLEEVSKSTRHDHPHAHEHEHPQGGEQNQILAQAQNEELLVIQRQNDKIYGDLSNNIEIFGELISYKKNEFNPEFLENAKEKLELKLNNSCYLYTALQKEAAKDKKHSKALVENLEKQKKVVLNQISQLKGIIEEFKLQEEYNEFCAILNNGEFHPYQFQPLSLKDVPEDKLDTIATSINLVISKYNEISFQKNKEIEEGKLLSQPQHEQKIELQIGVFLQTISHAPDNDVNYLLRSVCNDGDETNYIHLIKMIKENAVNLLIVDSMIASVEEAQQQEGTDPAKAGKLESLLIELTKYKESGSPLK